MGTAAGTVARQVVSRAVASAAAASSSSRPVASLAAASPFRIAVAAATAAENQQPYPSRMKVTSAPPPGPDSSLLEPTWRESSSQIRAEGGAMISSAPLSLTRRPPAVLRIDDCSSPGTGASVRNAGPDRPLSEHPLPSRQHSSQHTRLSPPSQETNTPHRFPTAGALHAAPTTFISPFAIHSAAAARSLYPNSTSIRTLLLPPCNRTAKPQVLLIFFW